MGGRGPASRLSYGARRLMEYGIRFVSGGLIVSLFAMIGLFGAAPSVALVSLTLAFWNHDAAYVSIEGRSMILGAIAFAVYSFLVCQLLMRVRCSTLTATSTAIVAWLFVAIGLEQILLG